MARRLCQLLGLNAHLHTGVPVLVPLGWGLVCAGNMAPAREATFKECFFILQAHGADSFSF